MPAALAPQAMGGGMKKPPFGSSPAVAGGSRNAPWIAPPEPETIPDAPAVVERPKAPESVKPTRSRLLQAAYETIMNGNPYLFARGMEMYEKGNSEQTELDEKAAERDQEFRKMGYNADLSDYTDSRSAARSDTYARRRDVEQRNFTASENFKSRVFQHGEGETERAFQAAENAKNRAAARINAAISAAGSGRGRPLSFTAAEKLAGHAAVLDNAERLKEGFKDKYVGHPIFGDARVALNKIIGGDKNMANWWQDYEAWKQQVRHDLYGASLTKNEKEAFEKYVVTPGTNPKIAADNIERQRAIAATGLARMSRSAAASYGIESVYEAIGRDPTKLNTTATLHAPTPGGGGATGKTGDPLVDKYLGSH